MIEQDDGLVVIDATESPASRKHLVQTVKRISAKPVKFLIYAQDGRNHEKQDGAFLRAWPMVIIVGGSDRGGTVLDDIRIGIDSAAKQIASTARQLTRIELPRRLHTGWRRIVAAVIS